MDFGIKGKWGLVCAGSKGLGRACAESLAEEGVNVVIVARGVEALAETSEAYSFKYECRGQNRSR